MDSEEVTNLKSFVSHRLHETHDIIHVLTGFGTDLVGEMGLQAFALAQNRALWLCFACRFFFVLCK